MPFPLTLAHSPDPDDAFMWWGLNENEKTSKRKNEKIGGGERLAVSGQRDFEFSIVLADIQSLNERAERGEYDITAISAAQYPYVQERYAITSCGASFGENYGPKVVVRRSRAGGTPALPDLRRGDFPIAVPGLRTTAALVTAMILECSFDRFVAVPFDSIIARVAAGEFQAGVVIHEGQLSFEAAGLHLVQDVGGWWWERHRLPLPLGLNVIRRDVGVRWLQTRRDAETKRQRDEVTIIRGGVKPPRPRAVELHRVLEKVTSILRGSIQYGLDHRAAAVAAVMPFARGITLEQADQFIAMYVNRYTLEMGEVGRRAIEALLEEGHRRGLAPLCDGIEVIG